MLHHGDGVVEVVVVPARNGPSDLAQRLRAALAPATPDFQVEVRLATSIPPEPNGKISAVKITPSSA
jgi:hypothetical protein